MNRKTQKLRNKVVAGYVYADWCGHCTALKPVWKQMKKIIPLHTVTYEEINSKHQDTHIANINKKYGVNMSVPQGYPYIFKIVEGRLEEYNGERDAHKMAQWFRGIKDKKEEPATGGSMSDSFGKGIFRGGVRTKRNRNANKTRRNRNKMNKTKTNKKFFFGLF